MLISIVPLPRPRAGRRTAGRAGARRPTPKPSSGWDGATRTWPVRSMRPDGPKPLTCSGLMPLDPPEDGVARRPADSLTVRPGMRFAVRMTGLNARTQARRWWGHCLMTALPTGPCVGCRSRVLDATCDSRRHPWAGRNDVEQMAAAALGRGDKLPHCVYLAVCQPPPPSSRRICRCPFRCQASSSAAWSSAGNAFSAIQLDAAMRRYAEECVAVSQYQLESRPVPHKKRRVAHRRRGGRWTYTALDGDAYYLAALEILAEFRPLQWRWACRPRPAWAQCRRVR